MRAKTQTWIKMTAPAVAATASTNRPRRRWQRFSLRSLLILVTILCVWLGMRVNQARRQKEAVAALRGLGALVHYEHQRDEKYPKRFDLEAELAVPSWLRELAGDDFFQTAVYVQFYRPAEDEDLVHLRALPHVERLILNSHGQAVTDAGLAHLRRPDRLVDLIVYGAAVGDEFLARFAGAHRLEALGLGGTLVSDAGLDALQRMPLLKSLGLEGTRITDEGLAKLAGHAALSTLVLNNTAVTDAGLKHLAALPRLNEVHLEATEVRGPGLAAIASRLNVLILKDTPIDDTSLAYLSGAKDIQALNIEGTPITDDGLAHLHSLPKLSAICLEGTKVTKAGIDRLTTALPGLAVVTAPKGQ